MFTLHRPDDLSAQLTWLDLNSRYRSLSVYWAMIDALSRIPTQPPDLQCSCPFPHTFLEQRHGCMAQMKLTTMSVSLEYLRVLTFCSRLGCTELDRCCVVMKALLSCMSPGTFVNFLGPSECLIFVAAVVQLSNGYKIRGAHDGKGEAQTSRPAFRKDQNLHQHTTNVQPICNQPATPSSHPRCLHDRFPRSPLLFSHALPSSSSLLVWLPLSPSSYQSRPGTSVP